MGCFLETGLATSFSSSEDEDESDSDESLLFFDLEALELTMGAALLDESAVFLAMDLTLDVSFEEVLETLDADLGVEIALEVVMEGRQKSLRVV